MEEKTVLMVLKVDLECDRCYKKVKKVLAKFPQIRDQVYNEKQGIVLIKVVCCKPEKIMKKICSKGNGSIKSIDIKEPEKKKEEKKEEKKVEKKEEKKPEKKEEKKPEKKEEKKEGEKPKVVAQSVQGYPPPPYPVYGSSSYEGWPCYQYHGYGIPAVPPCYVGRPIYDSYGGGYGGRGYYPGHSSHNYNSESSTGCSVM